MLEINMLLMGVVDPFLRIPVFLNKAAFKWDSSLDVQAGCCKRHQKPGGASGLRA